MSHMDPQEINGETVIGRYDGHYKTIGRDAYKEKNPVFHTEEGSLYVECSGPRYILVDIETLERICELEDEYRTKMTWFVMTNGYVATHITGVTIYLHQLLTGFYGNGQGIADFSVDHIDRNKLNNRLSNLRIVKKEEQHSNAKGIIPGTKRNRKRNSQPLPPGITQDMMPKYVNYCPERYMTEGGPKFRECFRIEKHPNQRGHRFSTSKSAKVSIAEKLEEAKRIVAQLDQREITNVAEVKPKQEAEPGYTMPPYFHLTTQHGKPAVCFERRYDDGKRRVGIKVTIKEGETAQQAVQRIMEKVDVETGEKKAKPANTTSDGYTLPKGFSVATEKSSGKKYLSFQRNVDGKRYVGKTYIGDGEGVADVLVRLKETIRKRYELGDGDDGKSDVSVVFG